MYLRMSVCMYECIFTYVFVLPDHYNSQRDLFLLGCLVDGLAFFSFELVTIVPKVAYLRCTVTLLHLTACFKWLTH